jgi:predicted enzyme related to lactoylglutathione lyase
MLLEGKMTEFTHYEPGTFCWVDLATTDNDAAKSFYTQLFNWEFVDMPIGEEPDAVYTMYQLNGKNVAASFKQSPQMQGMPPFWISYISVADVDAVAEKVNSLGGTVMAEPFDVFDSGRMAAIMDPTGAAVSLWQPKNHIGAQICNVPGSFTWNELLTNDPAKAEAFYTGLFGWGIQTTDMGGYDYTSFSVGDNPNGGMMKIREDMGEMPSNWGVYFAVADTAATVEKANALGGVVAVPPTEIPNMGYFAVIQDPQGAFFTVMQMFAQDS